jgi:subtilisin family serine protease
MEGHFRDHGLFVSSMVHAVASQSHIHLIRVLNGHNLGDLPTLIAALRAFLERDAADRGGTLEGNVINLSLGLVDGSSQERHLLDMVRQRIADLDSRLGFPSFSSLGGMPAVSLYSVLDRARRAGAVVVASAGNELEGRGPKDAEAPACYPFVIGVAGHTRGQQPSSFTKWGDIAAPGGHGKPVHQPLNEDGTIKHNDDWLVGLSMFSGQPTGYMYWMGTSFAAPLVAGGAARLLLMGEHPSNVRSRIESASPPSIHGALKRFYKAP